MSAQENNGGRNPGQGLVGDKHSSGHGYGAADLSTDMKSEEGK